MQLYLFKVFLGDIWPPLQKALTLTLNYEVVSLGWRFLKPPELECMLDLYVTSIPRMKAYVWVWVSVLVHLHWLNTTAYLSALMYSSSTGMQGTLPTRTPIWISLNCRPRFSPRMVTLVPPWRGPVSGNSWMKDNERQKMGHRGRNIIWLMP